MMRPKMICLILLAWIFLLTPAMAAEVAYETFSKLPFGCFLQKSEVLSGDQVDAISRKLDVSLVNISNTYLQVQGTPIQVNILEVSTDEDAAKLHEIISKMKDHPAFCLKQDRKIIEFCNADLATTIKTAYEIGFVKKPEKVQYRVTAHISPIEKPDYMAFNKLFNVFLQTDTNGPSEESIAQIEQLSQNITFGKSLILRVLDDQITTYTFTPKPIKTEDLSGDRAKYTFSSISDVLDVPYIKLIATITCNDTGLTPTDRGDDESLLSATPYWPVDDPQVIALAKKITEGKDTPEEKIQALLEWLAPGENIKFSGLTGSRWGVDKVFQQKYGHCWDFSDCFITLSRAVGIPSRQVGGWLYGTGGHIWAEVLIDGSQWQQVDPTGAGKLSCGIYHIPYFTTETGEMPILYVAMPNIEVLETE